MLKFYECKVCEVPCIGMPHDGETYEKEVCSPECLAQLAVCPTQRALDGSEVCPICEREHSCFSPCGDCFATRPASNA